MQAAPAGWRVLGDVDDGAAKFAADGETLEDAKRHQQQRRRDADRGVVRQHADEERREAHEGEGREERDLAADEVADPAEDERAERPHDEADRKGREREDEGRRLVNRGKKMRGEAARKRAIEEEVVPLEQRPERRGADDVRCRRAARRRGPSSSAAAPRRLQAFLRKTGSLRPIR